MTGAAEAWVAGDGAAPAGAASALATGMSDDSARGAPDGRPELRLLGSLTVAAGAGAVSVRLGQVRQRALLAALALRAGAVVQRDQLVSALWGDEPPLRATKTLQSHVAQLRRALAAGGMGDVVRTHGPGYALAPAAWVDVARFEELMAGGREALTQRDEARARELLRAALALWRGDALADCEPRDWAAAEVVRLDEGRATAHEDLFEVELRLGRHGVLVGPLECFLRRHPFRERAWGLLMLALHHAGRQGEALRAYQRARAVLAEELGLEPGPELRRLEAAILAGDVSVAAAQDAAGGGRIAGAAAHRHHGHGAEPPADGRAAGADVGNQRRPGRLPVPLTPLVGRRRDLATVAQLLETGRLVTLTGVGGCGKTRLALAVVEQHAATGVEARFVDLSPLADPALVPHAVAAGLAVREQAGIPLTDTLIDALADHRLLLVLDNCEHLVEGTARVVVRLLEACPRLRVLVTSRELLRVPGERAWRIGPLQTPDRHSPPTISALAGYEAVQLFLERAEAARPGLRLADGEAEALATICARLDGLPLAIELAASRVAVLAVGEIAARLDDRFRLLSDGSRSARACHLSLHAAVEWSYELLSDGERALLRRLTTFAGSFGLDAVEAVWVGGDEGAPAVGPSAVELLGGLVSKSLVIAEPRQGRARYRLLETIREFAAARSRGLADEASDAHERLARHYLALAEEAEPHMHGADLQTWLERLESEHDNLRLVLAWCGRQPAETGGWRHLRLAGALGRYCYLRGHYHEGRRWLEDALARGEGAPGGARAKALHAAGSLAFYQCDYGDAASRCGEGLELYRELGDSVGTARSLTSLGTIARERGDYRLARSLHEQALTLFRESGDEWGVAHTLQLLGFTSWLDDDFGRAGDLSGESLAMFRRLGDKERSAWALTDLGAVAHYRDDPWQAEQHLGEALALFEAIRFKEGVAWALNLLGLVAWTAGSAGDAASCLERSLALHRELGDRWRQASVLEALAVMSARTGREAQAASLLAEATSIRDAIGAPVPPCERPALRSLAPLRDPGSTFPATPVIAGGDVRRR